MRCGESFLLWRPCALFVPLKPIETTIFLTRLQSFELLSCSPRSTKCPPKKHPYRSAYLAHKAYETSFWQAPPGLAKPSITPARFAKAGCGFKLKPPQCAGTVLSECASFGPFGEFGSGRAGRKGKTKNGHSWTGAQELDKLGSL